MTAGRDPDPAVGFVVPEVDVVRSHTSQNAHRDQVAVADVAEEEQPIERHVQVGEILRLAHLEVAIDDLAHGPHDAEPVLILDPVHLGQESGQVLRQGGAEGAGRIG